MKYVSVLLILLFTFSLCRAQNLYQFFIVNSNNEVIPYASLSWGKNKGIVSNSNGSATIHSYEKIDSVTISSIGYLSTVFVLSNYKDPITVTLANGDVTLPSIEVWANGKLSIYGTNERIERGSYFKNKECINLQNMQMFSGYEQPNFLVSFSLFISKASSNNLPFRIRAYTLNNMRMPDKDLIHHNIVIKDYKTDSWNEFLLDSLYIKLPPEGFFIGIEWLCSDIKETNGLCIAEASDIDNYNTVLRFGGSDWRLYKIPSPKGRPLNAMYKVKIANP
jgi:hypothetical protein